MHQKENKLTHFTEATFFQYRNGRHIIIRIGKTQFGAINDSFKHNSGR